MRVPPRPSPPAYDTNPLRAIFMTPWDPVPIQRLPSRSSHRVVTSPTPFSEVCLANRKPALVPGKDSLRALQLPTHNLPSADSNRQLIPSFTNPSRVP